MDSIKTQFRRLAGYDNEHTCKECKFCEAIRHGNKICHKCRKMGVSFSAATDIRLKDIACRLFEEDEK